MQSVAEAGVSDGRDGRDTERAVAGLAANAALAH